MSVCFFILRSLHVRLCRFWLQNRLGAFLNSMHVEAWFVPPVGNLDCKGGTGIASATLSQG